MDGRAGMCRGSWGKADLNIGQRQTACMYSCTDLQPALRLPCLLSTHHHLSIFSRSASKARLIKQDIFGGQQSKKPSSRSQRHFLSSPLVALSFNMDAHDAQLSELERWVLCHLVPSVKLQPTDFARLPFFPTRREAKYGGQRAWPKLHEAKLLLVSSTGFFIDAYDL